MNPFSIILKSESINRKEEIYHGGNEKRGYYDSRDKTGFIA